MKANVSSIFYVGQAVARRMIPRGRGKIVNIASVQAELARASITPYTATKGAVRNLTRGMATDWAKHGLQVNAIAPGYFETPPNQVLVDDAASPNGSRSACPLLAGPGRGAVGARSCLLRRPRSTNRPLALARPGGRVSAEGGIVSCSALKAKAIAMGCGKEPAAGRIRLCAR